MNRKKEYITINGAAIRIGVKRRVIPNSSINEKSEDEKELEELIGNDILKFEEE